MSEEKNVTAQVVELITATANHTIALSKIKADYEAAVAQADADYNQKVAPLRPIMETAEGKAAYSTIGAAMGFPTQAATCAPQAKGGGEVKFTLVDVSADPKGVVVPNPKNGKPFAWTREMGSVARELHEGYGDDLSKLACKRLSDGTLTKIGEMVYRAEKGAAA